MNKNLTPIKFKEANKNLQKPKSMTDEECSNLWIFNDGEECISCWKLSIWQRIYLLFHGKIWLGVLSGYTQPPVWLSCDRTVFLEN